jgi:glycosyltransferase involved in cell wall biosynthesis
VTSILILNQNGLDHLRKCVLAVQTFTDVPYELIVIDNGSTDGSQEYLRALDADDLTVLENPQNIRMPAGPRAGHGSGRGRLRGVLGQ